MNALSVLETLLLGINAYMTYRVCSGGERCGVALSVFLLTVFVYVASRVSIDESIVALALAFGLMVVLVLVSS
jgi:hypothetical protein